VTHNSLLHRTVIRLDRSLGARAQPAAAKDGIRRHQGGRTRLDASSLGAAIAQSWIVIEAYSLRKVEAYSLRKVLPVRPSLQPILIPHPLAARAADLLQ
jgi:hypothetical protein